MNATQLTEGQERARLEGMRGERRRGHDEARLQKEQERARLEGTRALGVLTTEV